LTWDALPSTLRRLEGGLLRDGLVLTLVSLGVAGTVVDALTILCARHRFREVLMHAIIILGVLTFATALYTPQNLQDQSIVLKAAKDLPLAALFLTSLSVQRRPGLGRFKGRLLMWGIAFGALVAISPQPPLGVLVDIRYLILYPLAAVAMWRLDLSADEIRRVMRTLVILGVIEACIAIAQALGFAPSYYTTVGIAPRAIGTLGNPNNLGLFLGMAFLVAIGKLDGRQHRLSLLILLCGIAVTFSRATPVALALALVLPGGFPRRFKVLIGLVLLVALALLAVHVREEISGGSRGEQQSAAFFEWTSSSRTLFFGEGPGAQRNVANGEIEVLAVPDSMVLTLALDGGLVALVGFGLVLLEALRQLRPSPAWPIGLFFLAFTLVYSNFLLFPTALFFWIIVGAEAREPRTWQSRPRVYAVLNPDPHVARQYIDVLDAPPGAGSGSAKP
jgi:hypothetical protein